MNEKSKQLRQEWLRDSREIIKLPHVREDLGLFCQNANNIFRYNIGLGMLAWRDGSNPTSYFVQALDDISMYHEDLVSRGLATSKLPLSTAVMIAILVDRQGEYALECELDAAGDLFLDCQLGRRLQGSPPDPDVERGFERLRKSKGRALAVRSYETYFDLMTADPASSGILIARAEANFTARRMDAFYAGGPDIEGGGKYNEMTTDYRLSAIAKYRKFPSNSIHSWRW
jgi:hypothetical protein